MAAPRIVIRRLLALLAVAHTAFAQEAVRPLTPPPPPPPIDSQPLPPRTPLAPEAGTAPAPDTRAPATPQSTARVRILLDATVPNAELLDGASKKSLCRAPCGEWLNVSPEREFQLSAPGLESLSNPFTLGELSGDVAIHFTPRVEGKFDLGKGLTIAGASILGAAYVSAAVWAVVELVVNLVVLLVGGSGWLGAFEFLYFAAGAAVVGAPLLAVGIPTWVNARERVEVRPVGEAR